MLGQSKSTKTTAKTGALMSPALLNALKSFIKCAVDEFLYSLYVLFMYIFTFQLFMALKAVNTVGVIHIDINQTSC